MQKNLPSIEGEIRSTWQKTFGVPVRAFATSRTDAQVHALDQWVKIIAKEPIHFSSDDLAKINLLLPPEIRVLSYRNIPHAFDVMSMASSKEYCYLVANQLPKNLPLASEKILQFNEPLNFDLMQEAAALFVGKHNFQNFQRRETKGANLVREIFSSKIELIKTWQGTHLDQPVFCYCISAKGFLRQMVRIIMGAILNVGQGRVSLTQLEESLKNGDTKFEVGFVSPGYGLYLSKINY